MARDKLTPKQELFVAEYLTDLNATRAAIAAGYSARSAQVNGARLLTNAMVAAEIAKGHGKRIGKLELTADRVLEEISRLAFYDPVDFFESDGSLKQLHTLDQNTRRALAGIEVTELFEGKDVEDGPQQKTVYGLLKKVRLADKLKALELAGRHLKLFADKTELSLRVTLADLVIAANKPADETSD